jgi:transposase-like protein
MSDEEYQKIASDLQGKLIKNCPKCGCNGSPVSKVDPLNYRCKNKLKRHYYNILTGTAFENNKLPLYLKLKIIDCWLQGLSTSNIAWVLNINRSQIWRVIKKRENLLQKYFTVNCQ